MPLYTPTLQPSGQPSSQPSEKPSVSAEPSSQVRQNSCIICTDVHILEETRFLMLALLFTPILQPSCQPSSLPSENPSLSSSPSSQPSTVPSVSTAPSVSAEPSVSGAPSISSRPTEQGQCRFVQEGRPVGVFPANFTTYSTCPLQGNGNDPRQVCCKSGSADDVNKCKSGCQACQTGPTSNECCESIPGGICTGDDVCCKTADGNGSSFLFACTSLSLCPIQGEEV